MSAVQDSAVTQAAASSSSLPMMAVAEAKGHSVTVELIDGSRYMGVLVYTNSANGNLSLGKGILIAPDGSRSAVNRHTIRGAAVHLVRLPAIIRDAPFLQQDFFKSLKEAKKITDRRVNEKKTRLHGGASKEGGDGAVGGDGATGSGGKSSSNQQRRPQHGLVQVQLKMREARKALTKGGKTDGPGSKRPRSD